MSQNEAFGVALWIVPAILRVIIVKQLEVLDVIKELGGVKKFKELAEAISATNSDDIPF